MAGTSAVLASLLAFPAAWFLAFRCSARTRQLAILLLIIPFFTSYLVRTFSWYTILAEAGVLNGGFALLGLGPYKMLNTSFGTLVGYLTFVMPLVLILQTVTMANIDGRLIQAARNLGCPRSCTGRREISTDCTTSSPSEISWHHSIWADRTRRRCRS